LGIDAGAAALFGIEARRLTRVEEVTVGKRSGRRDEHSHARRGVQIRFEARSRYTSLWPTTCTSTLSYESK
jgi:hypothetical protein